METELIIAIGSAIILLLGARFWQRGNHLILHGKKTEAVIFKNNFKRTGSKGGMHFPVVRFTTDSKQWITQELSIGFSIAKSEGTKVQVIYDPDDPHIVEIHNTFQLEILPRIFVAIGLIGFVLAMLDYIEIIDIFSNTN